MKTISLEEWEAIGAQSKKVRGELFQMLEVTTGKLPLSLTEHIIKAIEQVDNFRSKAEDRMLATGGPEDLTIFYGGNQGDKQ